jgi:hypothetical protein
MENKIQQNIRVRGCNAVFKLGLCVVPEQHLQELGIAESALQCLFGITDPGEQPATRAGGHQVQQ